MLKPDRSKDVDDDGNQRISCSTMFCCKIQLVVDLEEMEDAKANEDEEWGELENPGA